MKLDDFTSAEIWTILTQKIVVKHVMLGTIWRIEQKRRIEAKQN